MGIALTVIISILVFGLLIFIHELGHYIFARIFKVTILEFSIGMGPKLIEYKSKKTGINYAIAAIPFGGYVAMAGEDSDSDDPNSYDKKPAWQRLIITLAGAAVNILAGFLAMIVYTSVTVIGGTEIYDFPEASYEVRSSDSGLMPGDVITHVDGKRVAISDELSYEIMRRGYEPVDITLLRDGEKLVIEDVVFPTAEESGQVFGVLDFRIVGKGAKDKTVGDIIVQSWHKSILIVRMCWESIYDLIVGRYSVDAVSGPVGISGAIGDAARAGGEHLLYITTLISINLGVMNLLPIPALDGGRAITTLAEIITRRRIPAHIEQKINAIGLIVLLGLSVLIMIKDVINLF
ncbi:MAG: site-2 protease family protein [Clostridia bacterium]|nr:site-2 protease family protein [Clostridia bacterium]